MKRIFAFLIIIPYLTLTIVYANGNTEHSKTKSRLSDRQRYEKYVQTPMSLASCAITAGEVKFKVSVWQDKNANPTSYDCQMKFLRWPSVEYYLPQITLTIGDSMCITMNNDSVYTTNLKTQASTVGNLKTGIQYLEENQFVAFYAYWYNLAGQVSHVNIVKNKDKNLVSTSFEILDADETQYAISGAGQYEISYQENTTKDEVFLQTYTYEPTKRWSEKYGFEKITCQLNDVNLQANPLEWDKLSKQEKYATIVMLKSVVRLYMCNSKNYDNAMETCNLLIEGVKNAQLPQLK